jgi:hypothetical protein
MPQASAAHASAARICRTPTHTPDTRQPRTRTHMHSVARTHACTVTHAGTGTHMHSHTHMQSHAHACTRTYALSQPQTHTHRHTATHAPAAVTCSCVCTLPHVARCCSCCNMHLLHHLLHSCVAEATCSTALHLSLSQLLPPLSSLSAATLSLSHTHTHTLCHTITHAAAATRYCTLQYYRCALPHVARCCSCCRMHLLHHTTTTTHTYKMYSCELRVLCRKSLHLLHHFLRTFPEDFAAVAEAGVCDALRVAILSSDTDRRRPLGAGGGGAARRQRRQ